MPLFNPNTLGYGGIATPARGVPAPLSTSFEATTITASATRYGLGSGTNTVGPQATQLQRALVTPGAAVLSTLTVVTSTAQPASGAMTVTLQVNGVNTGLTLTIPASGAAGIYSDLTHTVSVVAGDQLELAFVNAATASSAALTGVGFIADGKATLTRSGSLNAIFSVGASSTAYWNYEVGITVATEAPIQVPMPVATTLSLLTLRTNASQPGDGALTVTVRKNGVDTALTLTVPAGAAAGTFSDSTNSVAFAAGDLLSFTFVNASASASATMSAVAVEANGYGDTRNVPVLWALAANTVAAATTNYTYRPRRAFNGTQNTRQAPILADCVAQSLYVTTTGAQPGDGTLTFTVQRNGVDTGLTLTVGAGAAAATFSDTTNRVEFQRGDLIGVKVVNASPTLASATVAGMSLVLHTRTA